MADVHEEGHRRWTRLSCHYCSDQPVWLVEQLPHDLYGEDDSEIPVCDFHYYSPFS